LVSLELKPPADRIGASRHRVRRAGRSPARSESFEKNDWTARLRVAHPQAARSIGSTVASLKLWRVRMSAEKVPERRHDERLRVPFPGFEGAGNRRKLTQRLWVRCSNAFSSWSRPSRTIEAQPRQDMRWTCPDCSVSHKTVIDPDAEAGRIVQVNCQGCGTRHEVSVRFRPGRPGEARLIIGIVWL
jgi:hypothetical protein